MGIKVIDLDIKNLPLTDFMRAMGYEPTARDGSKLTYGSPYSINGSIVVDTEKNGWYDNQEPEKCYGGIYDLAYEITGSCNRSELNLFIASEMKKIMDFRCYEVLGNGKTRIPIRCCQYLSKTKTAKKPMPIRSRSRSRRRKYPSRSRRSLNERCVFSLWI